MQVSQRKQRTLSRCISYSGIGLHTGEAVTVTFHPAPENHGRVFRRADLPNKPLIPTIFSAICDTARNTTLGNGEARIYTVEHVLAAAHAR